jgi:hypothetical protein
MPKTSERLDAEIAEFWQDMEPRGGMVSKWFLVVEGLGPDGGRWIDFVWPDELKTWDVKGMLHEALDSQLAGMVVDEIREET